MTLSLNDSMYLKLSNTTGVTGYVGTKIYQQVAPQNIKFPYVVYGKTDDNPHHAMGADAKLRDAHYEVCCYSTSPRQVENIGKAVITALQDHSGTMGTSGATVQRIFFEGDSNSVYTNPATDEVIFEHSSNFIVWSTDL